MAVHHFYEQLFVQFLKDQQQSRWFDTSVTIPIRVQGSLLDRQCSYWRWDRSSIFQRQSSPHVWPAAYHWACQSPRVHSLIPAQLFPFDSVFRARFTLWSLSNGHRSRLSLADPGKPLPHSRQPSGPRRQERISPNPCCHVLYYSTVTVTPRSAASRSPLQNQTLHSKASQRSFPYYCSTRST